MRESGQQAAGSRRRVGTDTRRAVQRGATFYLAKSANHACKIPSGCKDRNALEFAQHKEIMIPRDQEIGFAGMGRIEEFVVPGIATRMKKPPGRYDLTVAQQGGMLGKMIKQSAGNRSREQNTADNRVGVYDKPLTGLHLPCA